MPKKHPEVRCVVNGAINKGKYSLDAFKLYLLLFALFGARRWEYIALTPIDKSNSSKNNTISAK